MKRKNLKGKNSLFTKMFRSILAFLVVIICVYTFLLSSTLLIELKDNASAAFNKQVSTRVLYLENEMNSRWSAIENNVRQIVQIAEQTVKGQGKTTVGIQTDARLNRTILHSVMENVVGTLRSCGATEIFLVLDGANVQGGQAQEARAGIYLRNSSPDFYASDTQNLLFERGLPALSKEWQLPLDSYWQSGFVLENNADNAFFYKPLEAARASENHDFTNFAYWSFGYPINPKDKGVLSYSVPLIASDGTVFGVMGVGVGEDHFIRQLDYRELGNDRNGAYLLAKTTNGVNFEPMIFNGASYNQKAFTQSKMSVETPEGSQISYLAGDEQDRLCVSRQDLTLYNHNTPFEGERWALLGIQRESELFAAYRGAQNMLLLLALGAALFSMLGVIWTSKIITRPIQRLVAQLRNSDPNRNIELQRVQVSEIDELAQSIEGLSVRVAAAFSKISSIIEMSEAGIGVFEYKVEENIVFCSRTMHEIMRWEPVADSSAYEDGTDFCVRMHKIEKYIVHGEDSLFCIPVEGDDPRWLKIKVTQDDQSVLGVVTDVTDAMREKKQIEYERDYDVLTNICNRRAFEDQAGALFEQPGVLRSAALIMWDLDNLKYVNDTYGHGYGDQYIVALANCLKAYSGEQMVSARRSGDEFITFLYGYEDWHAISEVIDRIWQAIERASIRLPTGNVYKLRVSAGLVKYPTDATTLSELYTYADFAMYTAKHNRKGTMAMFDPALYRVNRILLQGQEEFNNLLDNHLVRYMLQPIVRVKDGSVYGYEMLMRPEVPMFRSPSDVLRMAHTQSKLYALEVMTWFEAMKTFVHSKECGLVASGAKVFINSIANQILRPETIQLFRSTFHEYLDHIVCELTEEEQQDKELTREKTRMFRDWNAMVAIDDYGCGYNSEAILLSVAPDIVKIDINIVRNIHVDESRQRLVKNLVMYAKERSILVLAEGVETQEEAQTLIGLGADLLQGFYLARPSYDGTLPDSAVCRKIMQMYEKRKSA